MRREKSPCVNRKIESSRNFPVAKSNSSRNPAPASAHLGRILPKGVAKVQGKNRNSPFLPAHHRVNIQHCSSSSIVQRNQFSKGKKKLAFPFLALARARSLARTFAPARFSAVWSYRSRRKRTCLSSQCVAGVCGIFRRSSLPSVGPVRVSACGVCQTVV